MPSVSRVATGDIAPSRFVKAAGTTLDGKVTACGADEIPCGISHRGTRMPPWTELDDGLAAKAGENVHVYGQGMEAQLELGGTVTVGARLKSDADGKGVATTTNTDTYGAIAQYSGVAGEYILVLVDINDISK